MGKEDLERLILFLGIAGNIFLNLKYVFRAGEWFSQMNLLHRQNVDRFERTDQRLDKLETKVDTMQAKVDRIYFSMPKRKHENGEG